VVQTLGAQVQNEDLVTEEEKELETPEEKIQKFHEMKKELKAIMREKMEKEQANGDAMDNLTQRFGTLLVNKGRSRYINPGFWSHLNSEVRSLLNTNHLVLMNVRSRISRENCSSSPTSLLMRTILLLLLPIHLPCIKVSSSASVP